MQSLIFNSQVIQMQDHNNQVWFSGADVAWAIGYKNGTQAIVKNVSSNNVCEISLQVRGRKPIFISKTGLYELILKSDLLTVKVFQHWVYSHVLPHLTMANAMLFLLTLDIKESSDLFKQPFKANDIVMVDYGNSRHEAIVLDFLQNILVCVKFLDSDKIGFVIPNQLSKID